MCAHIWPGDLDPDAECEQGCGTTYDTWSEEDDTDEH